MKLRALIVDDEEFARKNLIMMLEEYCPEIEVIGEASRKEQAKAIIESSEPDVVFLDIRMPSGAEGFELLEEIENKNFLVVFVTAFKDYAIRAFNASAVYYVLKPIDVDELRSAVDRLVESRQTFQSDPKNYSTYFESLRNLSHNLLHKIIEDDTISHLEASGNCTTIYFVDGTRYLDTRTLKVYENLLNPEKFCRIHKSHIINLDMLREYINEDGHFAVLAGGKKIPVARNRVTDFVKMLKKV